MKELSLNILDIAQNSVKARATLIEITITEENDIMTLAVRDNGCGMEPEFLAAVTDPFTTTRTTRKVGLGLPLLKMEAEQTGGSFDIESVSEKFSEQHGTTVRASFVKSSIDFIPLGDMISTMCVLIQGADSIDYEFRHTTEKGEVFLSTAEMRDMLGDIPLGTPDVIAWVRDYLKESYESLQ